MKKLFSFLVISVLFLIAPPQASAHAFGAVYRLPIPFSLYLYAAAAVLLFSFLLIGLFSNKGSTSVNYPEFVLSRFEIIKILSSGRAVIFYQMLSVFLLVITIITGLVGDDLSAFNFNMTFFWILFVVGFTYLTFLLGNIWDTLNPWKVVISLYERVTDHEVTGIIRPPKKIGYSLALLLYYLFISVELFIGTSPFTLSVVILQYTLLTFFGSFLFGKNFWFDYGDFFSVFFRFIGYTSLLTSNKKTISLRIPFTGLLNESIKNLSGLIFILFMLSSTAFDGFRETNAWFNLYWGTFGAYFTQDVSYQIFEFLALAISPFLFLGLYLLCIFLMKKITGASQSVLALSYIFAFSLVPIALVYNIAHYFTLLLLQGQGIIRLISDPFGWGWNLFGTTGYVPQLAVLPAAFVWHFQVILILVGHIVSVYLAHIVARKTFSKQKKVILSQLPLLALMVIYTLIGLWILSQPIGVR